MVTLAIVGAALVLAVPLLAAYALAHVIARRDYADSWKERAEEWQRLSESPYADDSARARCEAHAEYNRQYCKYLGLPWYVALVTSEPVAPK